MLPLKANGAWAYSYAWTLVNGMPSRIVSSSPSFSPLRSPWISEWCAQVTVVPEHSRIKVLSSGKSQGFSTSMPLGGQRRRPHRPPREDRAVEKGPEPGEEEHHFGGDEQDHPVAQVKLDDRRVIARMRLLDRVRPPAEHGAQHAGGAERDTARAEAVVVEPHDSAAEQEDGRDRADERPGLGSPDDNRGSSSRPCLAASLVAVHPPLASRVDSFHRIKCVAQA